MKRGGYKLILPKKLVHGARADPAWAHAWNVQHAHDDQMDIVRMRILVLNVIITSSLAGCDIFKLGRRRVIVH